jgi:Anticodon binding domain
MSAIGFFCEAGALTLDGARAGLCSFLLAHQSAQLPILLNNAPSVAPALRWLGVSWQEPPAPTPSALLDALAKRGLLYPCGCDTPSAPHPCLHQAPPQKKCYRLRLSRIESLRYQDAALYELPLRAEDPIIADEERCPIPSLEFAQRALAADVSTLITLPSDEARGVLLAALRLLEAKTPLRLLRLPALEHARDLPTIEALRAQGFLPHAVANALSLLFWSPPGGATAMSMEVMLLLYEPTHPATAPRFELARLRALNEAHIRALSFEELGEALRPFLDERQLWRASHSLLHWAKLAREEISTLRDVERLAYFVDGDLAGPERASAEILEIMRADTVAAVLAAAASYFAEGGADFHALRARIEQQTNTRRKRLFYPLRIALTGKIYGPSFPEVLPFLGARECLQRVQRWQRFLAR